MVKKTILKYASLSIVVIAISSVSNYIASKTGIPITNTIFWWILHLLILYVFFRAKKSFFDKRSRHDMLVVKLYLAWNLICIVRGIFIAENYWDFKGLLDNSISLSIPIVAYAISNEIVLKSLLKCYVKYALPLFILICLLITKDAYGFYLVPISFFIFYLPVLNVRWKIITSFFTVVVLFADLGARSNVIKFAVPILLLLIYYWRVFISVRILEMLRKLLMIAPFVLLLLAMGNVFNVFNIHEYIKGDYNEIEKNAEGVDEVSDLSADTRSPIYLEVLNTADKYNSWLIGRSPARGNETELFAGMVETTGRNERLGNEVAVLNIFTWTGAVGVILYMLVFYKASYLALNNSNNIFSKMIGLFVAFHWAYGWVEDINYFTLTTFFLWATIGFCFSKSFRSMSDIEMTNWVRGIFEKQVRIKELKNQLEIFELPYNNERNSSTHHLPQP